MLVLSLVGVPLLRVHSYAGVLIQGTGLGSVSGELGSRWTLTRKWAGLWLPVTIETSTRSRGQVVGVKGERCKVCILGWDSPTHGSHLTLAMSVQTLEVALIINKMWDGPWVAISHIYIYTIYGWNSRLYLQWMIGIYPGLGSLFVYIKPDWNFMAERNIYEIIPDGIVLKMPP